MSDNAVDKRWFLPGLTRIFRCSRALIHKHFRDPLRSTMAEIMTKEVRAALNDPAKRFRLVEAYLKRKASEPGTLVPSASVDSRRSLRGAGFGP